MVDTVDALARSRIMSRIRGKNTKPEMAVRRFLYAAGLRYRLHQKNLVGSPDIVLAKFKTAVFVHGCFWHHHTGCKAAGIPKTNIEFWECKMIRNKERDATNIQKLRSLGWYVIVIWECETRKIDRLDEIVNEIRQQRVGLG